MRLTDQQPTIIRTAVTEIFGAGANVWLFGSRVDDNKRGGGINLLSLSGLVPRPLGRRLAKQR
jgi:hypothetical protein